MCSRNCLLFRSTWVLSCLLVGSCCSTFSFMCSVLYIICLFLCPFPFLPLYCLSYLNLRLTITSLVCSYFWKLFLTLCNVHNEGIDAYNDLYWFWHDTCIRKLRHIALVKGTYARIFVIRYIISVQFLISQRGCT